jgi:UDP-3-O-[3-hydroxymyristoyl] N-acetylglucosamine deacetylase
VKSPIEVAGDGARARLAATDAREFHFEIDFPETGPQGIDWTFSSQAFRNEIAGARTFGRIEDRERLAAGGYGRGANLDNTLVFEAGRLKNPEAQTFPDEFVRHKVLDAVGDLALAGKPILG